MESKRLQEEKAEAEQALKQVKLLERKKDEFMEALGLPTSRRQNRG